MTVPNGAEAQEGTGSRQRTSELLRTYASDPQSPRPDEVRRLVAELDAHQRELEVQNQELQTVQRQLQAYRDRYIDLYDFAPLGYVTLDEDGYIQEINLAGAGLLGGELAELVGYSFADYVATADQAAFLEHNRKCCGQRQEATSEIGLIAKDGRSVAVQLHSVPVQSLEHEATFCKTAITDITDRKRAEDALRESEQFYRTLIETLPVTVVLADAKGRVSYISPAAKEMFGLAPGEGLGTLPTDWIAPEHHEVVRQRVQKVMVDLHPQPPIEYKMLKRDGTPVWAQVASAPLLDVEGRLKGVVTVCQDITARKQAFDELVAAKASAEQANRAKDHFLAILSHELRTPLTPVVMGLSMLQDRPDLDPSLREILEMVRRNVELEALLIDDLLDVSRIAQGKIEMVLRAVELSTIIQRAVEVCKADIEAQRLDFSVDWGPAAPYWIEADASRLQQVFWNLLKNAIKFTPPGGCLGIRCRSHEKEVIAEVIDSGIGMEPETLSRIFHAFEQAERSITRQFGGLGLGLAICRALVDMHGGRVEAHSEGRGKGATFRVRLPLIAGPDRSEVRTPAAPPQRVACPLRILLVEDHDVTAKLMRMVLTSDGHTVETAGDVAAALELAGQQAFDLLVSDLGLPDGSGHDLICQLRERGHKFPGIALSGFGQAEDVQRSREAGFSAHLTKPASREAVLEAIASVTNVTRAPSPCGEAH